jgi:peptidoglycan hydrolase-like protein with peptidoglycan-binding domain
LSRTGIPSDQFQQEDPAREPADAVEDRPGRTGGAALARRRQWLVVMVVATVAAAGGAVASPLLIRSPAQIAADAAPPPPSVLTATVSSRVLKQTVIIRGTVSASQTVSVAGSAPAGDNAGGKPVVTRVAVRAGAAVSPGQVLVEVSGRPIFALSGTVPAYRDLRPGTSGGDVLQLQRALGALGLSVRGDAQGVYGSGTKAAVRQFYTRAGYDPVTADPDEDTQIEAARDAVTGRQRDLRSARQALVQAASPATGSHSADLQALRDQVTYAQQDLSRASTALRRVLATSGPTVPASELVFVPGLPARVESVAAVVGHDASGDLLRLSAGALLVRCQLQPDQVDQVKPGQRAEILAETLRTTATGRVQTVSDTPSAKQDGGTDQPEDSSDGAPGLSAMTVLPDRPLDGKLAGQDVRVTIEAASSGSPVLAVPAAAISSQTDGRTTVTVLDRDGGQRRVEVRPGMSGDGYVQVEAVLGQLHPDDRVVVGR